MAERVRRVFGGVPPLLGTQANASARRCVRPRRSSVDPALEFPFVAIIMRIHLNISHAHCTTVKPRQFELEGTTFKIRIGKDFELAKILIFFLVKNSSKNSRKSSKIHKNS